MSYPPLFRRRPGLSQIEVLLAIVVVAAVAAPLSFAAVQGGTARSGAQEDLFTQQDLAQAVSVFSQDVRGAVELTDATDTAFTLQQVEGDGDVFVHYRIADGRLQRGESDAHDQAPATWRDLIDAERFKVEKGLFSYFSWGNKSAVSTRLFRRIEIQGLQVKGRKSGHQVDSPPISAVMREGGNARALRLTADAEWRAHKEAAHGDQATEDDLPFKPEMGNDREDAMFLLFTARNTRPRDITIEAFSGAWSQTDNFLEAFTLEVDKKTTWGNGKDRFSSAASPIALPETVKIPAGGQAAFKLFFKMGSSLEALALKLYDTDDDARQDPYLLEVVSRPAR